MHSYSNMDATNYMNERRKSPRQKSLFRGVVFFADNNYTVECTVRDISETGARLKFNGTPSIISEHLDLSIPIKGQTYRAKVVWSNASEIGVAFESYNAVNVLGSSDAANASHSNEDELSYRVSRLEAEIVALKQMIKRLQRNLTEKPDAA